MFYLVEKIIKKIQRIAYFYPILSSKYCCICNSNVGGFLPFRGGRKSSPKLMLVLDVVGSDVDNFECPRCRSHDRERHLKLYLDKIGYLKNISDKLILHFAPEKNLSTIIKNSDPRKYVKCDLYPVTQDIEKIDIENIKYGTESFDLVIANHVLEHVNDDIKALNEIFRVLKWGGYAILQTPFSKKINKTYSDEGIDTNAARLEMYGQEDHVRLYGKDIFQRIESIGFKSEMQEHKNLLEELDASKYGVNINEPFFLLKKEK